MKEKVDVSKRGAQTMFKLIKLKSQVKYVSELLNHKTNIAY